MMIEEHQSGGRAPQVCQSTVAGLPATAGRRPGLGHPSRQQSSVIIWSVDYEVWLVGMGVTADNGNSFSRKWMMRVSHHNLEGLFHGSMSSDR
jgi:hypothetical protein